MPHRATEDDDQARWEAPGARGSVPAPFDAYEDPEPVRAGDDEESRRMRRVIVFVVLLACLALAPLLGLALRLSR